MMYMEKLVFLLIALFLGIAIINYTAQTTDDPDLGSMSTILQNSTTLLNNGSSQSFTNTPNSGTFIVTTMNRTWLNFSNPSNVNSSLSSLGVTQTIWVKNLTDSSWVFLANSSGVLYTNGVLGGSKSVPLGNSTGRFIIGQGFNGAIDEVRVFNTTLSSAEIGAIYQSGTIHNVSVLQGSTDSDDSASFFMNNGTAQNTTYSITGINSATAINDTWSSYDGINDETFLINQPLFISGNNSPTNRIAISMWVNATNFTISQLAFGSTRSNSDAIGIGTNGNTGFLSFVMYNGSSQEISMTSSTAAMTLNTWHHIFAQWDGLNTSLYLDGVKQQGNLGLTIGAGSLARMAIGARGTGNIVGQTYFNGSIDEVRIYNLNLSDSDIVLINNSGRIPNASLPSTNLSIWYSFNEGSGNTTYNRNASGISNPINNATLNMTVFASDSKVNNLSVTDYSIVNGNFTLANPRYSFSPIAVIYNHTSVNQVRQVLYMSLNERNGTIAYDTSGSGNNGVITAATYGNDGIIITLAQATDYLLGVSSFTLINDLWSYSQLNYQFMYNVDTSFGFHVVILQILVGLLALALVVLFVGYAYYQFKKAEESK